MSFTDLLRLSTKQLRARKIETMLIVLAVALCVLVLDAILSPLYHSRLTMTNIEDYIVTVSRSGLNITGELLNMSGLPLIRHNVPDDPNIQKLTIKKVEEIFQTIPEAKFYFYGGRTFYYLRGYYQQPFYTSNSINLDQEGLLALTSLSPEAISGLGLQLENGSIYSKDDFLNNKPYIILGSDLANKLFPNENPIGKTIETVSLNAPTFIVLGVLKPLEIELDNKKYSIIDNLKNDTNKMAISSFTPLNYNEQEPIFNSVMFYPKTISPKLHSQLSSYLDKHYKDIFTAYSSYTSFNLSIKKWNRSYLILGIIASLILLIACINIMNLFFTRIIKQNRSIGLNMALGASKKNIFNQYLVTSLIQGLLGSLIGVLIFWLISKTSITKTLQLYFNSQAIIFGIATGVFMSLIFGLYPAILASKTSPVDALRME